MARGLPTAGACPERIPVRADRALLCLDVETEGWLVQKVEIAREAGRRALAQVAAGPVDVAADRNEGMEGTECLRGEEISFMPSAPAVLLTRAVVAPQGEARQEIEIAAPLLDRLEERQAVTRRLLPWRTQREFNTHLLGDSGITFEELEAKGYHAVNPDPVPAGWPVATPTGKIELYSTILEESGLDPLPGYKAPEREAQPADVRERYPLTLITGDRERSYHHSRFHDQAWAHKVSPDPRHVMHPETAAGLGFADGEWIRVEVAGANGNCRLRLKLSDATPRDVVNTGMG
jgi:thiosulfate reductase/polysulfide reductase chain A